MKTALQTRQGLQLTLTPQLQQAIRLLQLSRSELENEITELLNQNSMLEEELAEETSDHHEIEAPIDASKVDLEYPDIPSNNELPVDTVWEEIYPDLTAHKSPALGEQPIDWHCHPNKNLQQHLIWQMQLAHFSTIERAIATAIIDAIDDNGLLTLSLAEIRDSVDKAIDLELIEVVLHHIQSFEPAGVAARDLRECLLIQLYQLPSNTPHLTTGIAIIEQHFDLLVKRDFQNIMRRCAINADKFYNAQQLIQSLNPRPGARYNTKNIDYIIPDILIKKQAGRWLVELNQENFPRLKINSYYANLIQRSDHSGTSNFLRNHLQEARWFIKSLNSRHETLLKVSTCIIEQQRNFLEHGAEAMKPLTLKNIADELALHESTISRVTTQKFMHTPHGIFELKYFFSSHVGIPGTDSEYSATAVKAQIKKLVANENTKRPFSDHHIAKILNQNGIPVARRTVAKYREVLSILPSYERRSIL